MDRIVIKLLLFIAKAVMFTGDSYDQQKRSEWNNLYEEAKKEMEALPK